MSKERYHIIDALRGLSVVLMLAYHFGMTLLFFGLVKADLLYNPLLNTLEPIFAGLFILISGISSRFSRNNIKRGLITLFFAACVTAVSLFFGLDIWFGILHFLGLSMLLYGIFGHFLALSKHSYVFDTVLWAVIFAFTFIIFPVAADNNYFMWLGFMGGGFYTADYFPFFKWFPLFMLGIQLGVPIREHKLPAWFYSFNMPILPFAGRHALIIYLAHQPVFYLILTLFIQIRGCLLV